MSYSVIGKINSRPRPRPRPKKQTRTKALAPVITSTRFQLAKIRGSRVRIDCAPNLAYFGKLDPRFPHQRRVLLRAGRKFWQMFGRWFEKKKRFFSILVDTITNVQVYGRRRSRPLQFRRAGAKRVSVDEGLSDDEALSEMMVFAGGPVNVVARDLFR